MNSTREGEKYMCVMYYLKRERWEKERERKGDGRWEKVFRERKCGCVQRESKGRC